MGLKWTSTERFSSEHGVKVCVYGASKYGKTKLCATAPRPLIISAEKGLLSLRGFSIPAIEVTTVEELTEAYNWLVSSRDAAQFDTVCLDSISEIGEVILAHALTQVKDPRMAYGEVIEKLSMVIRCFRDLPKKHVYFICKMEPLKDEMTGQVKWGPMLPGKKMGPQLPYFFDEFFCIRLHPSKDPSGNHYRYLQTAPDLQYDAGDRSGSLAPMEPPDLTHIFNKIMGVKP